MPLVPGLVARGSRAAVVAPHHLASAAGLWILRSGGNAVDAAVATNAVLAVVAGNSCGLGGDAFWLIWDATGDPSPGRLHALNGSGRSAAAADAGALRSAGHRTMPIRGPHAITVPGAVRSWGDALARFGRLTPAQVLAPAIELAGDGFPAWDGFIASVESAASWVAETIGPGAGWFSVYRPHGRPWRPGERVRLPALASTLERLARAGIDDFYDGELGERQTAGLAAAGSRIDRDDLRGHASTWGEPIAIDYRGVQVATHPPNSSGMVGLQMLGILDRLEPPAPAELAGGAGPGLTWLHQVVEANKIALAERDAHLTDPEAMPVPVDELLSPGRLAELAATIRPDRALEPAAGRAPRGGGTAYMAAVDADGNAVSLIESNYMGFGSGVVDPATGIAYHNRGSYFSLEPDHPNVLAPRKRTLHTLLPAMLLRDGRPWVILGSMGGDAQPAILAQTVSGIVDGRLDVATAVAAPRCHAAPPAHFAPTSDVLAEPRFRPGVLEGLGELGHQVVRTAPFDAVQGHCHAIELVDGGPAAGGSLAAAADPRSAGLPAVS